MARHRFQEEWKNPSAAYEQTDADRLPDAIASIGRTAYAAGPATIGGGAGLEYAWRVRAVGSSVVIDRLNDAHDGWEQEQSPFPAPRSSSQSVSLGFTTAGHPVVAVQKPSGVGGAPEVWVGFLNSLTQEYDFENFGPGRSPVCFLDTPLNPTTSDVTVMYINADNTAINYRLQRDRYEDEYEAITAAELGVDLSLAYLILGGGTMARSRVLGVIHDPVTGTYPTQFNFFSALQGFSMPPDEVRALVSLEDLELRQVFITNTAGDEPRASVELMDVNLRLVLIDTASLDESLARVTLEHLVVAPGVWLGYGTEEARAEVTLEDIETLQIVIAVPGPAYGAPDEEVGAIVTLEALETVVP